MRRTCMFVAFTASVVLCLTAAPRTQAFPPRESQVRGPFYVRSLNGKCLTFGSPGSGSDEIGSDSPASASTAVYLDICNDSTSGPAPALPQRVMIQELSRREVVLRFQDKAVGVLAAVEGVPLQLQALDYSAGQRWAFDGDTLISTLDRTLVVSVKNGRTPRATPAVLKRRDLDDSELWNIVAVDGSGTKPHGGFVRIPTGGHEPLEVQLQNAVNKASWGTVIEIDQNLSLKMDPYPLVVLEGVTIRGDRRGTRLGPELKFEAFTDRNGLIDVMGDNVRITGLRIQGPSTAKDEDPMTGGISITDAGFESSIVDRNELWGWTHAAVRVKANSPWDEVNPCGNIDYDRPRNVKIVRNFIHHNIRGGLGYGVTMYPNGFATITGNTFVYNRHAISSDGKGLSGYRALYNLVTSAAPAYGSFSIREHDFDMHGTVGDGHNGGHAGSDVTIDRNTFLGTNRRNYVLRGIPCLLHRFTNNIVRRSDSGAIQWFQYFSVPPFAAFVSPPSPAPVWLDISSNRFDSSDPTDRLGVGDFDGDGKDDLFLATGTAWYYASSGLAEWRLLNRRLDIIDNLRFGDVDGDGRTDVLIRQASTWFVSWAGASKAEKLIDRDGDIRDFAVADFNGDRRADLLHTDGQNWFVSSGAVSPFTIYEAGKSWRVRDLQIGNFNTDARADIFVVSGGAWMVRYGGTPGLSYLRPALSSSAAGLVAADFDGDGRTDLARSRSFSNLWLWDVSYRATEEWSPLRAAPFKLIDAAAVGRFDGTPGADVLDWNLAEPGATKYLDIASSGGPITLRHSRDHMR